MSLIDKLFDSIFNGDENSINEFEKKLNEDQPKIDYTKFNINFKNLSNNPNPEYATPGSSGFDLRANVDGMVVLKPGEFKIIPTGLIFELPDNMEIQVRSRSSLSAKHGVTVLNGIGTIDSDYRSEIGVILINHGKNDFNIYNGDRIAQGVIMSVFGKNIINLNQVDEIDINTIRGTGGFGSTGIK